MGGIVLALILLLCYMFRKHSPGRWALAAITAVFYLLSIEWPHPSFGNGL